MHDRLNQGLKLEYLLSFFTVLEPNDSFEQVSNKLSMLPTISFIWFSVKWSVSINYQIDESISKFRHVWSKFSFLCYFQKKSC